jgi:predicted peptidase
MRFWHYSLVLSLATLPYSAGALGLDRGFLDRLVTVDGSVYRFRVFVPQGWSTTTVWPVILSLHGAGGYGSDGVSQTAEGLAPAIRRHPERFPALAVFPQSPASGTPGWQEIGGRIALAALDKTIEEFRGDRSRITLTGLSIGGNGAWYLAYHHPERFAGLLVVCGFVSERKGTMYPILYPSLVPGLADPSTAVAQRLAHIPTWIFHGDADHTVPVEQSRRMAAALRALGAPVQYTELAGVDHNAWDYTYDRADVARWLLQQRLAVTTK